MSSMIHTTQRDFDKTIVDSLDIAKLANPIDASLSAKKMNRDFLE
ncbi:hypothetical protein [Paenibacillus sp. 1011MAR3C5]|nr:hypothetical protein [Paenibacillus sp. 1011MAR3C5]